MNDMATKEHFDGQLCPKDSSYQTLASEMPALLAAWPLVQYVGRPPMNTNTNGNSNITRRACELTDGQELSPRRCASTPAAPQRTLGG